MDFLPAPPLQVVAQCAEAPAEVRTLVRAWNLANKAANRITAKSVVRAGRTTVELHTVSKFGAPLCLALGATDKRTVTEAIATLARYATSDGPTSLLADPGRDGKNAAPAYEKAPRDVVTVF